MSVEILTAQGEVGEDKAERFIDIHIPGFSVSILVVRQSVIG